MRARGCVRAHTHRLHVWQVTRCMEHGSCLFEHGFYLFEHLFYFLRTRIFFVEHEFYFFEHEFNELNESWCLRNIILARIKRIFMDGTGSRNWSKGSHTDLTLTDFLMRGRIDEMKRIFRNRTFSWKTDGVFMRRNEYLCKTEGRNE